MSDSSTAAATAVVDGPSTSTTAAPKDVKQSWADEVDDDANQSATATPTPTATATTSSTATSTPTAQEESCNLKALSIKDPKLLDEPEDINIQAVPSGDTPYMSAKRFEDLNLSEELLKGLYVEMRFEKPSKVQAVTLPMILTPPYKNLIAQAHNGSGKTTCFVLGMLSRVDPKLQAPQALCICPTRELAIQNLEVLEKMGKYTGITAERAIQESRDNPAFIPIPKRQPIKNHVVIGTPGTILSLIQRKKLSLVSMKILVYDEADHMLAEDGFREDSLKIMKAIPSSSKCQVLLFSATFNDRVKDFVTRTIPDPNQLFVKKEDLSLDAVKQYKVCCPSELEKVLVVKDMILELGSKVGQTIIFVRTRQNAVELHKELTGYGYEVTTIQGALDQADRDAIVREFKEGLTQVLISTDVLARGFDQSQVNLVVNYELPFKHDLPTEPDYEVYLHRVGRAGRFGRKGAAFNLLCGDRDERLMEKIENHFGIRVSEVGSWNSEEDFTKALQEAGLTKS